MREVAKGYEYRKVHLEINRAVQDLSWELNKIKRTTRMMKMLNASLKGYLDYVDLSVSSEERDEVRYQRSKDTVLLTKQNKKLADEVAALKSDIETAKKESGLFIKFVRKMMGEGLK